MPVLTEYRYFKKPEADSIGIYGLTVINITRRESTVAEEKRIFNGATIIQ